MISKLPNIPRWGFVSGRISALEIHFLPREFFIGIITQGSVDDIIPHLQETFLGDYLTPGRAWDDFGALSDRCFYDMALSIRSDCPSTLPADIFLLQGDYLNLKNAFSGMTAFPFPMGTLSYEKLSAIARGEYVDLPKPVAETEGLGESEAFEVFPGVVDIFLDGAYLRHLLSLAHGLGSEMVSAYIHDKVLASIVMILWRAVQQGIPIKHYRQYLLPLGDFTSIVKELTGMQNPETWHAVIGGAIGDLFIESMELGTDDQVSGFDLRVANHLTRIARDGKSQTAGPERVFAFLAGFLVEMQNLKLAVTGRLNRIDQGLLKRRLRDCYV